MSSETHCKQLNMSNMNVVPCRSKITARLKAGNWQTDKQMDRDRNMDRPKTACPRGFYQGT